MGFQKAFDTVLGAGCAVQAMILVPILLVLAAIGVACFFCSAGSVLLGSPTPTPVPFM